MILPENGSNGVKSEVMRRFLLFFSGNPYLCLFRLLATARQGFLASDPICKVCFRDVRQYEQSHRKTGLTKMTVTAQFLPGILDAHLCKNKQTTTGWVKTLDRS